MKHASWYEELKQPFIIKATDSSCDVSANIKGKDDGLNELKILGMMMTSSYTMSCYLSVAETSGTVNQSSDSDYFCTCANDWNAAGFHFCPANKNYVPHSHCRQHLECNDPIYNYFDLAKLCSDLAKKVPEYGEEYKEIAQQAMKMSVQLLDQCLDTCEVELLLGERAGSAKYFKFVNTPQRVGKISYPRLMLAIELNNKEFVSHMYCQQMLRKEWYSGVIWEGKSLWYKVSVPYNRL